MKIIVTIATLVVKTMDCLLFTLKPKENKVTYISYNSNTLPNGMANISSNLIKLNPKVNEVYLTLKFTNSTLDKVKYAFEILKQIYHVKTSKLVFIDGNNFVISNLNLEGTTVIQLWHSSGALKKFGMDYKRKYTIRNYDYMITSSESAIPHMAKAFNMKEEQILPLGYADNDVLFNKQFIDRKREQLLKKYPFLKNKKVVLYAPTFRGEAVYDKQHLNVDLQKLSSSLGDNYAIIYKVHPILGTLSLDDSGTTHNLSNENIYTLFSIADILVSDYSSIIYDFSILEKPIVLYAPDIEEYKTQRGLYVDYNTFSPYDIETDLEGLSEAILRCDTMSDDTKKKLKLSYFKYTDGQSAKRVAEFSNSLLQK